jgi:hypothetical protein
MVAAIDGYTEEGGYSDRRGMLLRYIGTNSRGLVTIDVGACCTTLHKRRRRRVV